MKKERLITGKVILASVILALVLFMVSLIFLFWIAPNIPKQASSSPSMVITVISAATSTPRGVSPSPPAMSPTPPSTLTPLPGVIAINRYVQISGTEGDGLRLRSSPSLSGDPLFLGNESEVFLVKDGPIQFDGFKWWYLTAPYDETRSGWAVENYLVHIPAP